MNDKNTKGREKHSIYLVKEKMCAKTPWMYFESYGLLWKIKSFRLISKVLNTISLKFTLELSLTDSQDVEKSTILNIT